MRTHTPAKGPLACANARTYIRNAQTDVAGNNAWPAGDPGPTGSLRHSCLASAFVGDWGRWLHKCTHCTKSMPCMRVSRRAWSGTWSCSRMLVRLLFAPRPRFLYIMKLL